MAEDNKKRWLIKDADGHVRGPFFTDDILSRIASGEISGAEKIALYPGSEWVSISTDPTFYDQLLNILYKESDPKEFENESQSLSRHKSKNIAEQPAAVADSIEKSKNIPKSRVERVRFTQHQPNNNEKEAVQDETGESPKPSPEQKFKQQNQRPSQDIELKKKSKLIRKKRTQKTSVPIVITIGVLLIVGLLFFRGQNSVDDRIRLLAPRSGQPALAQAEVNQKIKNALTEFVNDNFSNYIRAQEFLVQAVEGDPRNMGAMALTCLTYLELWEYSYQDSTDLSAITTLNQIVSRVDPAGVEAATCRTVDLLVRGRLAEAKGLTEMVLDTFAQTGQPPIAFYFFKALLFENYGEFDSTISYARSAEQLWPQWLRIYALEAEALYNSQKYGEAANVYRHILKSNPNHKVAQIKLGLIEYLHLKNYQSGEALLRSAMGLQEGAPRKILSQGYLGLAEISLASQDLKKALDNAELAYRYNSSNTRAKEIIVQIAGEDQLKDIKLLDSQLVYEGDQFVREGDCNAAQAHYRTAFEINKKNGLAAMKAAECLWRLSLSTEAISWLDLAIRADINLIDAYVLLADYYSQRFNYQAAGQILSKAKAQAPTNYKVYRGYAMVELRRNNFLAAKNYAEKAIQIYESDVDSYIILAQALMPLGEAAKAFDASSKAIEIDLNNQNAQVAYAQTLAAVRGMNVGIDYLVRMINTYPTISEYRMALGELYFKDQRYSSAQEVFSQLTKIQDKPKKAYMLLALALQKQNMIESARDAYFKAASLDPSDVEPLFLVGMLYLQAKQPGEARIQFQRVLRINKDYPLVNYYLGKAALDLGEKPQALEQANIEKLKNPNLPEPYMLAAEVYTEMKQYSDCAGEYQKAIKFWQGGALIYVKLARCFRMAGNIDAALSMINQAGIQESGNPEVWKEQGAIYEMRQENIKAIEAYNQYIVLAPNAVDRAQIESRINHLSR